MEKLRNMRFPAAWYTTNTNKITFSFFNIFNHFVNTRLHRSNPILSLKFIQNLFIIYMSLSQQVAIRRASLIRQGSINYNFSFILQPTKFNGLAQIVFFLQKISFKEDLELDFSGDSVEALIVNDIQIDVVNDDKRENFIYIPRGCLQKGKNRVSVLYQSEYNNDHSGFISYMDGGQQFLFTDFQPYEANRVFPCFDQPNLKAVMKLTVIGPEGWRVISNESPIANQSFRMEKYVKNSQWSHQKSKHLLDIFSKKVKDPSNTKMTVFPQTKLLPTYIFCLCAGNYLQITPKQKGTVPMSIFCTTAGKQNMDTYSDFIFNITQKCMDLYQRKFKVPYPFNKFDQIFIRQFGAYAMQNAGIVTYDQSKMLPKENPTQYDYYIIGNVVSHELSHHWFGNYVTMTWWDDLWLNESFAQWMACYSLEQLKVTFQFQSLLYFRDGKVRGYRDDQRNNSTHPIRGTVANTDEAFSIFDGITYEKGASALKQLSFLVGEDNFFAAVSKYFSRFPWQNATIDDLLQDISQYFPESAGSLNDWKRTWLQTASVNVFSIDWDQTNSKITLKQKSFNDSNVLRVHKIKIALFNADSTFTTITNDVIIKPVPQTQITYQNGPYAAVLVNHQDETFVENIIDPISLAFFKNNVDKIEDTFTRMMIWYNFRSMVKLSLINIADYVGFVKEKLFKEQSTFILEQILYNLHTILHDFLDESPGDTLRSSICQIIYTELQTTDDTLLQRIQILQEYFVQYSHNEDEIHRLWGWLNKQDDKLAKRQMNFDQKWKTVKKIFTINMPVSMKWQVYNQVKGEDTDTARVDQNYTILKVLVATQQQFEAVYQQFKGSKTSMTVKYLKVEGWMDPYNFGWIYDKYRDRYFADIVTLSEVLSYEQFQFFYEYLRPIDRDLQSQIQKYREVIAQLQDIGGLEQHCRNLQKIIDDLTLRIQNTTYNNADFNLSLARTRAIDRFSYIQTGSISYNFHLTFVKQVQYYEGLAQISFTLTSLPAVLPLDCVCDSILQVNLNKIPITPIINGQFLFIPQCGLKIGANTITIHYRNKYNNDGLGCMSYLQTISTPPSQYIYTNFQPYGAHRFVPCFDQPDFKASAQFNVIVPSGWMVVGNEAENYQGDFIVEDYKANITTQDAGMLDLYLTGKTGYFYTLKPTPKISTYLYCVAVGEYYELIVQAGKLYRQIPMSLFCIQSYKDRLLRLAPFIVEITTLSLQLFEQLFDTPYQFSKYDTIFCHQYKPGAMENPGLITFKDTYLFPEAVSLQKMLGLASTIIHENSHNWFGDYVTMKWWDDLWLNESFADFIAHYGLQMIKDKVKTIPVYDSGWKIFLVRGVPGYREDQITQTTHAVRSEVANTSVASTYFDRITYQKGSATLKQFMFLMGQENFFKGVQAYFKKFGWQNATIDDFLGEMQPYFERTDFTLDDWKKSWLLTPSLNTGYVQWDPIDVSPNATLTIHQNYYSNVYPTLRYHQTRIAMFLPDATYDVFDVLLTPTNTTTFEYDGTKGYVAVLVNVDYWDYFKYTIDEVSLAFFEENLNKITNVLTRMIIWHDINEQVRDSNYKVTDYIDTFNKFIFDEKDDKIFEFQFSFVRDALNNYIPIALRSDSKSQIFEAIYDELKSSPLTDIQNRIILLKDQLSIFAVTNDQVKRLQQWRNQNNPDLAAFRITVSQSWQVVKLCFASDQYPLQIKTQTYQDQYHKTPGIQGQLALNTCNAIIADAQTFDNIFLSFQKMDLSLDAKESYASGWNNLIHLQAIQSIYKARYFADLPALSRTLVSNHFEWFYQNLRPIDDNLDDTITSYANIKLQGSDMLGHIKVLTQIKYNYELRAKLYKYNA